MPDYNVVYEASRIEDFLTPADTWSTRRSEAQVFSKAEAERAAAKWQKLNKSGVVSAKAVPSGR